MLLLRALWAHLVRLALLQVLVLTLWALRVLLWTLLTLRQALWTPWAHLVLPWAQRALLRVLPRAHLLVLPRAQRVP